MTRIERPLEIDTFGYESHATEDLEIPKVKSRFILYMAVLARPKKLESTAVKPVPLYGCDHEIPRVSRFENGKSEIRTGDSGRRIGEWEDLCGEAFISRREIP